MSTRRTLSSMLAAAALVTAAASHAQVSCDLQVPAMSFGRIDVLAELPADRSLGSIDIICRNSGNLDVAMLVRTAVSAGSGGTDSRRRMVGPGGISLEYNLFRDVSRTQLWRASGDAPTAINVGAQRQVSLQLPVFGRLYGPQTARPGAYADWLTVTLDF
ncbi:MAG: spore coat protein U domain-containing protein [Pseudomonadota bacterium]|jgi:spore coat protein U-like protein